MWLDSMYYEAVNGMTMYHEAVSCMTMYYEAVSGICIMRL